MITTEIVKEYNNFRTCSDKSVLCHAPFTNIYFNQSGHGVACCYNSTHVLGTYPHHSIREMWFGAKAQELREAIRNNDLSGGCSGCAHQLTSRNFTGHMSVFDRYADKKERPKRNFGAAANRLRISVRQRIDFGIEDKKSRISEIFHSAIYSLSRRNPQSEISSPPSWFQRITLRFKPPREISLPKGMEFSLTNVCNLECVMCSGYFSSLIRHRREKLLPMKNPYDLDFVEQLEEFIPSLSVAKFYGGEPFLIKIYYEIWERIRRLNPAIEVHITTNATTLTERAKALLDSLNCHLIVSIDSLEKETYEQIRKNASYEQVMQNVAYLQAYSAKYKRTLSLVVCPMQQNWQELPHMVQYCNQHDIIIGFNTVYNPPHCSLRTMSATELTQVVDDWNAVELPANNWLTTLNRNRFRSVMSQVAQWRDESLHGEPLILSMFYPVFASEIDDDDPYKEMVDIFVNVLQSKIKEHSVLTDNLTKYSAIDAGLTRHGAINATLKRKVNDFLAHKLANLSEETFLEHYFNALKEAYLAVNQEGGEARSKPKNELLSKIDALSAQTMQHPAREALVAFLVKQDIRNVLDWLENNPLEAIGPFIRARYG